MPFTVDPLDPAAPPLPIDLAEPDAPAPVGDRRPCHVFWAPMPEPLGPVLRPDAGRLPFTPAQIDAAMRRHIAESTRAVRRARMRRIWDEYHEWIAAGVIIAAASLATVLN